jgi:MFS family permease
MVGGVIADFYHAEDRNWAMAVFAGGAIGGTGLGPLVSGFVSKTLGIIPTETYETYAYYTLQF